MVIQHKEHLDYEELGHLVSLVFRPGGYLSHHFKNYNYREDQEKMSLIIAKGISNRKAAIIEAGTGTGKSLGVLVPSSLYATICNKRVLVVTHNIALQSQLFYKDVPLIQKVLASMGLKLTSAIVKGKGNYICTKKLKDIIQKNPVQFREEIDKLLRNATKDGKLIVGDRERLPYNPSDKFWSLISPSADENCDECPFKEGGCFYKHYKKKSEEANIIVSNQFMLIADLIARRKNNYAPNSGLLPDYDILIVDEAHHIEDVATEFLSTKISKDSVMKIINRIERLISKNYLKAERNERLKTLCNSVKNEVEKIFRDAFQTLDKKHKYADFWEKPLQGNLAYFDALLEELMFNHIRIKDADPEVGRLLQSIIRSFEECVENFKTINSLEDEREFCYWVHKENESAVIVRTPIEVNKYLREGLFERMPVILTSATIKFDKDLSFFAKKVGKLEAHEYESGFMMSPFDYENQVCFYIPEYALDAPKAGDLEAAREYDEYCYQEMIDLVTMSKGRAFLLFTSISAVEQYYNKLAPIFESMGYLCLRQGGEYDRNQMVTMFKEHGHAVLFGADTFWEGISIDGRELSLVVIHKLPFAVPNPVSEARQIAIKRNGGDPFLEGHVFSAVTKYKQGFGRLIRHENDKGVFCVLDGRILSQKERYGKYFLKGTPKTFQTMDKNDLVPFF